MPKFFNVSDPVSMQRSAPLRRPLRSGRSVRVKPIRSQRSGHSMRHRRLKPITRPARSFGSSPTPDPRWSSINADVDRLAQAKRYPLVNITTLGNGLRVVSEAHDSPMVTVGVIIDAGSRYEQEYNNGTAHFLEHMFFKGTGKRTRHQLELEIEQMGGSLNAHTTREQTTFTMTVMKEHMPHAIELFGDIILNSTFHPQSIANESQVILEEHNSVSMDVQEVLFDKLHETAYRGSSLGFTILGSPENIQRISKADIQQYIKSHYIGPRMIVSVVGDCDPQDVVQRVKHHFASVPALPPNGIFPQPGVSHFVASDIRVRDDDMPKAHVAIGFETAGWNDPDHFALLVLQTMIGSYNRDRPTDVYSSSHYPSIWARMHLADSVAPFNTIYKDTGIFGLHAVASCNQLEVLSKDLLDALIFHHTHVPEQSLVEAKAKLSFNFLAQYENTDTITQELARQLLAYGRRLHPYEALQRIADVDELAVQQIFPWLRLALFLNCPTTQSSAKKHTLHGSNDPIEDHDAFVANPNNRQYDAYIQSLGADIRQQDARTLELREKLIPTREAPSPPPNPLLSQQQQPKSNHQTTLTQSRAPIAPNSRAARIIAASSSAPKAQPWWKFW